ncbi:ATP-dependent helicase [Xylanibacillus composti]|uniref:Helicase n=1 Tax=Xylanibacillus composti TaxID=1572762 RepID=A0A8J4H5Q0_9BACL|nr:SNF2-related protein [Xylanibacillus composti]MDT9725016.1 ATP-dependent helicase [Xylanibacillus composti]GIQ71309.1 helicase [Xylanibacillus composti]
MPRRKPQPPATQAQPPIVDIQQQQLQPAPEQRPASKALPADASVAVVAKPLLGSRLRLELDRSWTDALAARIEQNGPWDSWPLYQLAVQAERSALVEHFDALQCLRHLSQLEPLPHQLDTAKKVLNDMRGRAILADEVGLGKTIEAGLILKEYIIRGLVRKVLILVPASLVLQWVRELNQKFGIPAVAQKKAYMWTQCDIVVASMDTAKRDPHREIVLQQEYDMLIIDEAHKLKNKKTTNYQFVSDLRKKYCLLLTATPVQNDLKELFNLISLLKPGQLGGQSHFQSEFVMAKRMPKNKEKLQEELSKVMIRNRRGDADVNFTKRHVKNVLLDLSKEEYELYQGVTEFVKGRYREAGGDLSSVLSLVTLQREVCSSRDAVFITLVNLFKKTPEDSPLRAKIWELVDKIKQIQANTKAEKAMEIIRESDEKVIVFTEYRATQEYLLQYLKKENMIAVPYRGGMNRGKKDWMMDLFRGRAQVMVATEAGGEGINLQFCRRIINFDLPWNPMRVEQRIGRIHRLGQKDDVQIYNLSTRGTIEEHILNLLHEKINMFELVIGQLDLILERLEQGGSLESRLYRIMLEAENDQQVKQNLDELGNYWRQAEQEVAGQANAKRSPNQDEKEQRQAEIGGMLQRLGTAIPTETEVHPR